MRRTAPDKDMHCHCTAALFTVAVEAVEIPRFIPYNHDQNSILVVNYKDQLQPGTFEHAVHYLIQHKLGDLSIFYPKYSKRHQNQKPDSDGKTIISANEFQFDPVNLTCICPAGQELRYEATRTDEHGVSREY